MTKITETIMNSEKIIIEIIIPDCRAKAFFGLLISLISKEDINSYSDDEWNALTTVYDAFYSTLKREIYKQKVKKDNDQNR